NRGDVFLGDPFAVDAQTQTTLDGVRQFNELEFPIRTSYDLIEAVLHVARVDVGERDAFRLVAVAGSNAELDFTRSEGLLKTSRNLSWVSSEAEGGIVSLCKHCRNSVCF